MCYFAELKTKESWYEHHHYKRFDVSPSSVHESQCVDRIRVDLVSPEDFIEKYEKPYKPVVILGAQTHWRANHKWTVQVSQTGQ